MSKIAPYIELPVWKSGQSKLDKLGFKINRVSMRKLKNGFIELVVEWNGDVDFKYGSNDGKLYGGNHVHFSIDFPVSYRYQFKKQRRSRKISIDVGIQTVTKNGGHSSCLLNYEPLYFQNLKYGVVAYFAPKNWGKIDKVLFDWGGDGENGITRADWFRA